MKVRKPAIKHDIYQRLQTQREKYEIIIQRNVKMSVYKLFKSTTTAVLFGAWSFPCAWQPILDHFVSVTLIGQTDDDLLDCVKYTREAHALPPRYANVGRAGVTLKIDPIEK